MMNCLKIFLLLSSLMAGCLSARDSTSKNESLSQFTGQGLIDMGDKLDNLLLKLIGKTVRRVENQIENVRSSLSFNTEELIVWICRLHSCSEWSEWSECDDIHIGEFGSQIRRRDCGLNTTLCKYYATPKVEHERRICERKRCPRDYTSTGHGFCLKFYDKVKLPRDDAEKVCQADSGHLVNVDSETKVKYVNETILKKSFPESYLWIDGRRSKPGGLFAYGYKSTEPSFTFWGDNDPDNGVAELCIMYHKESYTNYLWRWFDTNCNRHFAFICQYQ